jgi:beta-lactamase regulating signal transducer with metallopeptidase domain
MTLDPVKLSQLAWALAHFLWQGVAIAVLLGCLLRLTSPQRPRLRYAVACAALAAIAAAPVVSLAYLSVHDSGPLMLPFDPALASQPGWERSAIRLSASLQPALPWIVGCWCAGAIIFAVWHVAAWFVFRRGLRGDTSPLRDEWNWLVGLVAALKIRRPVAFRECRLFDVPATTGWLRPLVLLPSTALAALRTDQVKAVVVHELAHVRRYDYPVNLLQSVVEGLLFFHPAVWWVSTKVRQERESCCDEIAAVVTGDRGGYAKALLAMEELRPDVPLHALGARGTGGSLLARVERILGARSASGPGRQGPTVALAMLAGLLCVTLPLLSSTLGIGRSRGLADVRSLGGFTYSVVRGGRAAGGPQASAAFLDQLDRALHAPATEMLDATDRDADLIQAILTCGDASVLSRQIVVRMTPQQPLAYQRSPSWRYGSVAERVRLIERLWTEAAMLRSHDAVRARDYGRAALLLAAQETCLFGATAITQLLDDPECGQTTQLSPAEVRQLRQHVADHQTIRRVAEAYHLMVQEALERLDAGERSAPAYRRTLDLLTTMARMAQDRPDVAIRVAGLWSRLAQLRSLDPGAFENARAVLMNAREPALTRWVAEGPPTARPATTRRVRIIDPQELVAQ